MVVSLLPCYAPGMKGTVLTRDILEMSAPHITGATLDLGAGTAKYKDIILQHASSYTTFDVVEGPNIDIVGDVLATRLPDASFDTVICTQVMEHVSEPWRMAEEISRMLKPGGACILTVPFMMPYHADPYDYFRYTTGGVEHLFKWAGLETVTIDGYGGITTVLAEMLKFGWCSPYKKHSRLKKAVFRVLHKMIVSIPSSPGAIYANTYYVGIKR